MYTKWEEREGVGQRSTFVHHPLIDIPGTNSFDWCARFIFVATEIAFYIRTKLITSTNLSRLRQAQQPKRIDIKIVGGWNLMVMTEQEKHCISSHRFPRIVHRCRWRKTFLATKSHRHNGIWYIFNTILNSIQINARLHATDANTHSYQRTKF